MSKQDDSKFLLDLAFQIIGRAHPIISEMIVEGEARATAAFRAKDLMLIKPDDSATPDEVKKYRDRLTALGFTLGREVDNLFLEAVFPPDWTKDYDPQGSRHMRIKDEKGRDRITIFYKDTPYDRYASCNILNDVEEE